MAMITPPPARNAESSRLKTSSWRSLLAIGKESNRSLKFHREKSSEISTADYTANKGGRYTFEKDNYGDISGKGGGRRSRNQAPSVSVVTRCRRQSDILAEATQQTPQSSTRKEENYAAPINNDEVLRVHSDIVDWIMNGASNKSEKNIPTDSTKNLMHSRCPRKKSILDWKNSSIDWGGDDSDNESSY